MDTVQSLLMDTNTTEAITTLLPSTFTVTNPVGNTSLIDQLFATNSTSADEVHAMNASSTPDLGANDELLEATKEILFTIQYFLLPFFLLTGLLGNTLTIVTMASRHFSHMTSRYILIFLAFSDTVLLLTQPFNKLWVIKLFGQDLRSLSEVSCKVFFVIFRSSKMTSSWLVVLLCFERFVAVVFPLRAKTILRKRIIFPAIFIDYFVMFAYNSVWSFSSQVVNGMCKPDVPSLQHKVFVIIGCSLYSFIPTFLLMVFTPKIIFTLRKQMKIRRALSYNKSSDNKGNSRKNDDMVRASFMVLGVMIAYIVLIIPITMVHLLAFTQGVSAFDLTSYGFFVFREVAQMLEQINYAVNFFFYILCSTTFRHRVVDILCLRSWRSGVNVPSGSGDSRSSRRAILQKVLSSASSRSVEPSQ